MNSQERTFIYGKHAVHEALKAREDVVLGIYVTDMSGATALQGRQQHIPVKEFFESKLPKGVPRDAIHQGVIAEIDPIRLVEQYDDFIQKLSVGNHTALVLLGEVQDPQNVGAIIRSAAAFGIAGVLIPEHRQVQINGTIIKVSAGMAFRIPLVQIGNVNSTIQDLKERGFWTYGLDGEAKQSVHDEGFEKPTLLVLGNEGSGIRQKTLEHCDIPLRIPMVQGVESLNAATAASVVFYAWSARHTNFFTP